MVKSYAVSLLCHRLATVRSVWGGGAHCSLIRGVSVCLLNLAWEPGAHDKGKITGEHSPGTAGGSELSMPTACLPLNTGEQKRRLESSVQSHIGNGPYLPSPQPLLTQDRRRPLWRMRTRGTPSHVLGHSPSNHRVVGIKGPSSRTSS